MNVGRLINLLEGMDSNLEVVVDLDENGFYNLVKVELATDEEGDEVVNLVSSNEI